MAKISYTIRQSIPANTVVNVLTGSRFETVAATGLLMLAHIAAAPGLTSELFVANRNNVERSPILDNANLQIHLPQNVVVDDVECFGGEKIQLNIENTTGSAVVYAALLILDDNVVMR